jgi:4-carboxymuconolactone decarboxylase
VEIQRMATVRSDADGRAELGSVYLAMFNNPAVARQVGTLGEHLRFAGTLPGRLRETAILRFASRSGFEYAWAHHVRPAMLAGLNEATIAALAEASVPREPDPVVRAVVVAVDHIVDRQDIPEPVQNVLTEAVGAEGVVELVALCGLYGLIGYMTTSFAITPEPGLPAMPRA